MLIKQLKKMAANGWYWPSSENLTMVNQRILKLPREQSTKRSLEPLLRRF
jgi:hypothetical protein